MLLTHLRLMTEAVDRFLHLCGFAADISLIRRRCSEIKKKAKIWWRLLTPWLNGVLYPMWVWRIASMGSSYSVAMGYVREVWVRSTGALMYAIAQNL